MSARRMTSSFLSTISTEGDQPLLPRSHLSEPQSEKNRSMKFPCSLSRLYPRAALRFSSRHGSQRSRAIFKPPDFRAVHKENNMAAYALPDQGISGSNFHTDPRQIL